MTMTRSSANPAFLPEQSGDLVVRPVARMSRAIEAATDVYPDGGFRVPIVADDATAAWTPEGQEIDLSDVTLDEDEAAYKKLASLTKISSELSEDSSPEAGQIVGRSVARDIARKLDAAYFGTTTVNGPDGIGSVAGVNALDAGASWTNLDVFEEGVLDAEDEGAVLSAYVANKTTAKALVALKEASGSNRNLIQPDPTKPSRRLLAGVPLLVSPAVADGTVWGIPGDGLALVVIRRDVKIDVDHSVFFTSDSVAVRSTMRVYFSFPHPAAVQKIALSA